MNFAASEQKRYGSLWRLSRLAFWPYRFPILLLAAVGFVSGLLEGVGVNAIIPVFSFAFGADGGSDFISRAIKEVFLFLGLDFNISFLLIFIVCLFIFKALALLVGAYIKFKITTDYETKKRNELLGKTLSARWPYLLRQKVGYLETVLITDIHQNAMLLADLGAAALLLTTLLMYLLVAVNISFPITLVTMVFGGFLLLLLKPLAYRKRQLARTVKDLNKELAHFINEIVLGVKTVKALTAAEAVRRRGLEKFSRLRAVTVSSNLLSSFVAILVQPVSLIFIVALFIWLYRSPGFNFGAFAVIIYLIQRIFVYLEDFLSTLHRLNYHFPFLQATVEYETALRAAKEHPGPHTPFCFNGKLVFDKVSFFYQPERPILREVSFAVKKGEMVGIIGASGAGKTTVVDLLLRFLQPQAGAITLDGTAAHDVNLESWRAKIGYVSQDIFLLNDTFVNNIKFYDNSITDADMVRASKLANIYEFIQSTPERFNTNIGERGLQISAGQRQRVIIARVLARRPEILILDEATSALDNESEIAIQKAIEGLRRTVTVLVIAHRLSTVMNCDRLLVLEDGRIAEQGAPGELLKNKKTYFYKVFNLRPGSL